jgi:hypothetical protein
MAEAPQHNYPDLLVPDIFAVYDPNRVHGEIWGKTAMRTPEQRQALLEEFYGLGQEALSGSGVEQTSATVIDFPVPIPKARLRKAS